MPCYHPLKGYRTSQGVTFSELRRHDHIGTIEIACGQCIGCKMRRASDWELRIMHEAQMHERNCAITLTYGEGNLPPGGSLHYRDVQLFWKRLRKSLGHPIKYYVCGEYGDENGRPHYHACIFNLDFEDRILGGKSSSGMPYYNSATLEKLWGLGICSVQDLVPETASYCARYIMKKITGEAAKTAYAYTDDETGEIKWVEPEFARMSNKGGIGAAWIDKYHKEIYRIDRVVQRGDLRAIPKYYDKRMKKAGKDFDEIEHKRDLAARKQAADNTPERRQVREAVHLAKVATLKRGNV